MRRTRRLKKDVPIKDTSTSSSEDEVPIKTKLPKAVKQHENNSSSESDIENYLQRPEDLDLNSTFFQPVKERETSFHEIEKDIFAGINKLSDSDESEDFDKTDDVPLEKLRKPKTPKKSSTVKTGVPKLNFQALHDYTNKIEEAKRHVEKYLARKQTNEKGPDIGTLLSVGERNILDSSANSDLQLNTLHSSDFDTASESENEDWEVVKNTEISKENKIPKEGLQITLQGPDIIRKKKGVDLLAALKRRLNRIKKENQVYVHKVHILCWLAHGNYVNETLNKENVLGLALSLLPSQHCYPSDRTDLKYLEQILNWYRKTIKNIEKPTSKTIDLENKLCAQMSQKEATNKKYFVYIFICILRSLGIQCRLVLSLQVEPLHPPASELNSLSTKENKKDIKDNNVSKDPNETSVKVSNNKKLDKKNPPKSANKLKNLNDTKNSCEKSQPQEKLEDSKDIKRKLEKNIKSTHFNQIEESRVGKSQLQSGASGSKEKQLNLSKLKTTNRSQRSTAKSQRMMDLNEIVSNLEELETVAPKNQQKKNTIISLVDDKKKIKTVSKNSNVINDVDDEKIIQKRSGSRRGQKRSEEEVVSDGKLSKNVSVKKKKDGVGDKRKSASSHKRKLSTDQEIESTDELSKKNTALKDSGLKKNQNISTFDKPKRQRSTNPKGKVGTSSLESNVKEEHSTKSPSNNVAKTKTKPNLFQLKSRKLKTEDSANEEKKIVQLDGFYESSTEDDSSTDDDSSSTDNFEREYVDNIFKIPQLDGSNDDQPSTSTTKIDLKKLNKAQPSEGSRNRRSLKIKPIYKDSNSEDDFKPRTPFTLKNVSPIQRKDRNGSVTNDRTPNKSTFFGSPTKKLDVRNDIVRLVKSRIQEEKHADSLKKGRKVKASKDDSDSDYAPESFQKKEHDDDYDDFVKKVKVKKRLQPKKEIDRRVFSSDEEKPSTSNAPDLKKKKGIDIWVEVYLESEEKWISVDVIKGQVHCVKELYSRATHPVSYIVSWDNTNNVKDISKRYCPNWNTVTRKLRAETKWLDESFKPFKGRQSARDKEEDEDLARQQLEQPLPTAISEYKNHPLYVLKRHLLKFQSLYPPEPPILGFVRKEAVYSRDCVFTLHSREIWVKHAKVVKPGEEPYKIVKARPKYDRMTKTCITDKPLEIFGEWQTGDYEPPTAENGVVPRNAYGNVELFKACMLPKKTVHLQLPGLNKVARKMNVDCVPAVVGFDFHSGSTHPTFDGYVVCEEFSETLIAAWYLEQEEAEKREIEKVEKRVYGNWRRLIKGLLIRERLKNRYDFGAPSHESEKTEKPKKKSSKFLLKKRKICSDNEADSS